MWRKEFGDDYAVPDVIDQHKQLVDTSWHNDASPSFAPRGLQDWEEMSIRLWVQHPNPAEREADPNSGRFIVSIDDDQTEPWDGDNVDEAVAKLLQVYRKWRKANPSKATRAKEERRKAQQAAEDAANDAAQLQHAAEYPDGCPDGCGPCSGRLAHGLTIGRLIVLTHKHPWRGPERRGMEAVTTRCRIRHVRANVFDYSTVEVLGVEDPLPGGAYDGDKWRAHVYVDSTDAPKGGMTWSYAFGLINSGEMRVEGAN